MKNFDEKIKRGGLEKLPKIVDHRLRQHSKEAGTTMVDTVATLGVDLRARVKRLGAKEKRGGRIAR